MEPNGHFVTEAILIKRHNSVYKYLASFTFACKADAALTADGLRVSARGRPWPRRPLFSISGGQYGENLSPFTAMATACKSPWVKRNTATAIYSPGSTPDEMWRMSEQDGGGHMHAPLRDIMALSLIIMNNRYCLLSTYLFKFVLEVKK